MKNERLRLTQDVIRIFVLIYEYLSIFGYYLWILLVSLDIIFLRQVLFFCSGI